MDTTSIVVAEPHADTRRFVLIGAAGGLAWGIAMRAWMRFIATQPEFSWSGTLFILGAATIAGTVLGLAWHRRAAGGRGWWRLSVLCLLLLGAGGAVMWPAVLLGAVALGRPWRTPIRITLGALAAASQIPVVTGFADNWKFGLSEIVIATLLYIPLLSVEVWAFSVAFRPSVRPEPTPRRILVTMAIVGVIVLVLAGVVVTGMLGGM